MNLNQVTLLGRLTRNIDLRDAGGTKVGQFGLAVNETYRDKAGETVKKTCFVDVDCWDRQAEACAKYLEKGSPVLIEGKLVLEQWKGNDGQARSRHKVRAARVHFIHGGRKSDAADQPS